MKKQFLAGAGVVAALGVAALPVATFAADGDVTSYTETVTANVPATCGLSVTDGTLADSAYTHTATFGDVSNGATDSATGAAIKVICNNGNGWTVSAVGAGSNTTDKTEMVASDTNATNIDTGTTTPSFWNFEIAATNASVATGYATAVAVPGTAATIVTGTSNSEGTAATITPTYNISISTSQGAGTYTGAVSYTLAAK